MAQVISNSFEFEKNIVIMKHIQNNNHNCFFTK